MFLLGRDSEIYQLLYSFFNIKNSVLILNKIHTLRSLQSKILITYVSISLITGIPYYLITSK